MADDYTGGTAADELSADGAPEGQEPKPDGNIFIEAFPGSENLKPGDPVPLRMVGQTHDGQIECEPMPPGDGEPEWKADLKKSVHTVPGGGGIGNGPENEM